MLSLAQQVSSDVRAQMLRRDDDPGLGARLIAWGARNVAGTAAPAAWSRRIRGVWEVQRPGPPKCARSPRCVHRLGRRAGNASTAASTSHCN